MKFHSIWVGDTDKLLSHEDRIIKFIATNPEQELCLWLESYNPELEALIISHLPNITVCYFHRLLADQERLLNIYQFLKSHQAYEAASDILRYLILYEEGGVYVDINFLSTDNVDDLFSSLKGFKLPIVLSENGITTLVKLIFSEPKHFISKCILRAMVYFYEQLESAILNIVKDIPGEDKRITSYFIFYNIFGSACANVLFEYVKSDPKLILDFNLPDASLEKFMASAPFDKKVCPEKYLVKILGFSTLIDMRWSMLTENQEDLKKIFGEHKLERAEVEHRACYKI